MAETKPVPLIRPRESKVVIREYKEDRKNYNQWHHFSVEIYGSPYQREPWEANDSTHRVFWMQGFPTREKAEQVAAWAADYFQVPYEATN